ncbi:MAG TPA: class II glutamine amidotransferase [Candidatus Dormibacteraeota bacterium]|nr:class II glutamine amidotransferase [Candidatus Dormibacteraeota bacterium]
MCELLAAVGDQSFELGKLLDWARRLEIRGFAGYGWGTAWVGEDGLDSYKHPGPLAEDGLAVDRLAAKKVRAAVIHLRRPTDPKTVTDADTQPFVDEAHTFAFCHNGFFKLHDAYRPQFAGRLHGSADTEVAFRMLEKEIAEGVPPTQALLRVHDRLTGNANCTYLQQSGELLVYAANAMNAVWRLRKDDLYVAVTGSHWRDDSGVATLFPGCKSMRLGTEPVSLGTSVLHR